MKIGDYVRTKYGISKCIGVTPIRENSFLYEFDKEVYEDVTYLTSSELEKYKSNPNIIDLIEVGDYVNGLKVTNIAGTYHGRKDKAIYCDYCENKETGKWTMIYDDEIKSIVTKEQFESIAYKVGE